jgi:hypothetical protein
LEGKGLGCVVEVVNSVSVQSATFSRDSVVVDVISRSLVSCSTIGDRKDMEVNRLLLEISSGVYIQSVCILHWYDVALSQVQMEIVSL